MESRFPNINKVRRIKRGKRRSLVGAAYDLKRFYFLAEMSLSNGTLRGIKCGIEKLVVQLIQQLNYEKRTKQR